MFLAPARSGRLFNALTRQGCGPYLSPAGVARSRRFQHEFTAAQKGHPPADTVAFYGGRLFTAWAPIQRRHVGN